MANPIVSNQKEIQKEPNRVIDLETKLKIINDCSIYNQARVAELYQIHPTTVSKIIKEKEKIERINNYQKMGIKIYLNGGIKNI